MAINKVVAPNSVPTNVSDYVAQNAHMMGFMTQVNMQAFVLTDPTTADKPKIALGSYIAHGGSLYKVEGGDETISGSPADGKVYVRVTGNATLSASFISDISGYSYNHAYGTMTSGAYTLLPYEIRKSGSNWVKYRYDAVQKLQAETLNTGQGDNLLYAMNQNVRTADAVTFATVNTGQGATEVHLMNQNLRTTDSPTFAKLKLTTSTYGTQTIAPNGVWVVPVGIYQMVGSESLRIEIRIGSSWFSLAYVGAIVSDGSNIRIKNTSSGNKDIYYREFS